MSRMINTAQVAAVPADLLRAAITHSSLAIAVCDHHFAVRYCNPALARLIDPAAAPAAAPGAAAPATAPGGVALLQSLGIGDADGAMAEARSLGGWTGIATPRAPDGATAPRMVHVAVEAFRETGSTAGWLITAREQPGTATPPALTERELIAASVRLTPREREVMLALHAGATNKAIAQTLKISPRTVEFHRARIMQRFAATSLVDLVRKVAADARG